jgi:hypothetical protein
LQGDNVGIDFPWAGAVLLLLLAVVAVAMRWRAQRHSGATGPAWLQRWMPGRSDEARPFALSIESSMRLDGQTQLHAVRWKDRELLVATSLNASPVLLESRATGQPMGETEPGASS